MSKVSTPERAGHRGASALRSGLRWATVTAMAATSVVALSAWAHGDPGARGGVGMDRPMMAMAGGHGGHGAHGERGGWLMGRGLERMLDAVNATDAQRTQIRQIAEAARTDLQAQRAAHQALRDRAMSAFTAPTVDAREVETVRQQMLAQHDATSKRMSQAMLDASRVLTPEQRTQLAERLKQRSERMRRSMEERQRPGAPQG